MNFIIPRIGADNFDWLSWLRGDEVWIRLGFRPRYHSIIDNAEVLRRYAIGYIPGNRLFCRPEQNGIAVMFSIDGIDGWTHLRKEEFERVFAC